VGLARQTILIEASPERVWAMLVDAQRLPEWNADVVAVEDVTGPLDRAGAGYTQVFTAGGREVRGRFEILSAERFRSREMRATLPMMSSAVGRDTLEPVGDATQLTVELEFELKGGRVARMGEPLLAKRLEAALAKSGAALKQLLESDG